MAVLCNSICIGIVLEYQKSNRYYPRKLSSRPPENRIEFSLSFPGFPSCSTCEQTGYQNAPFPPAVVGARYGGRRAEGAGHVTGLVITIGKHGLTTGSGRGRVDGGSRVCGSSVYRVSYHGRSNCASVYTSHTQFFEF